MRRQKKELQDRIPEVFVNQLESALYIRETGRCMSCGTAIIFYAEENGDTRAECPGCGQVLTWSPGFFE